MSMEASIEQRLRALLSSYANREHDLDGYTPDRAAQHVAQRGLAILDGTRDE